MTPDFPLPAMVELPRYRNVTVVSADFPRRWIFYPLLRHPETIVGRRLPPVEDGPAAIEEYLDAVRSYRCKAWTDVARGKSYNENDIRLSEYYQVFIYFKLHFTTSSCL
jgi:hypothetical protein